MNEIEIIEDVISDATKTATRDMTPEVLEALVKVNEIALGQCDRLIDHEMLAIEKHLGEITSIMNATAEEKQKLKVDFVDSVDELDEMLANIRILGDVRKFLAARNAALT
jgi:hypothetical protein